MRKALNMAAMCSVMAMVALSCSKEKPQETPDPQGPVDPHPQEEVLVNMSLTAGVEDPADTKVFSTGNILKWNGTADHLAVFADVSGNSVMYNFQKEAGSSATSTTFSGSVAEGATLRYASYPYSPNRTRSGDVLGLMLANHQGCAQTNSVPLHTPLYGIVSGGSVTMKTPCAFLKITLPKTTADATLEVFDSLRVLANNCAGNFTVDLSAPATPVVSAGDDNHIAVAPKKSYSSTVYVPILPGTYDDITIRLEYKDGHSNFSKQSTQEQTFLSGKVYNCGDFAGPYVESVTTGAGSCEESTLSLAGSAVLWKYAGVTNSDYTFKFFYAPHGTAKDASGWTEVAASSVSGDGTAVTFSASATVAAGAYDFYAQVSDGSVTIDGGIEEAVAKVVTAVEWVFADIASGSATYGSYTYDTEKSGYKRIVNSIGEPVFPTFSISLNAANYYYQEWNGSNYGETIQEPNGTASSCVGGLLGGTITRLVDGQTYSLRIKHTASYYTFTSNLLCHGTKGFNIQIPCPDDGFKIKSIVLGCAADKTCIWGIGSTGSLADIVTAQDWKDASNPVAKEFVIPAPIAGHSYYLISGNKGSRATSITVYYEH